MPYKSKTRDRLWHRDAMRRRRSVAKRQVVTPSTKDSVTPSIKGYTGWVEQEWFTKEWLDIA